jgi:hypothetical protein
LSQARLDEGSFGASRRRRAEVAGFDLSKPWRAQIVVSAQFVQERAGHPVDIFWGGLIDKEG